MFASDLISMHCALPDKGCEHAVKTAFSAQEGRTERYNADTAALMPKIPWPAAMDRFPGGHLIVGLLVVRFIQIAGYRCLSLMRALGVVKCQLAFA